MSDESHKDLIRKADKALQDAHDAIRRAQGSLAEIRRVESLSERRKRQDEQHH